MIRRLEHLEELTFPVELQPVYTKFNGREILIRDSQAVVHSKGGYPLGVVGKEYRLVTHAEALELGFECARAAFPETKPQEWDVTAVDAPSTGTYCFIDLAHKSGALDFSGLPAQLKPDVFGPFVRVTNSYNRSRALKFDVGYFRKVCKNGLILKDSLIQFSMSHQRRQIREQVTFEIDQSKLAKDRAAFQEFLQRLTEVDVPEPEAVVVTTQALGFNQPPAEAKADTQQAWNELHGFVSATCRDYIGQGGANAYSLMNAITDLASRPPGSTLVRRDKNSLQKRAGAWLADFVSKSKLPDFDLPRYVNELAGKPDGRSRFEPARP